MTKQTTIFGNTIEDKEICQRVDMNRETTEDITDSARDIIDYERNAELGEIGCYTPIDFYKVHKLKDLKYNRDTDKEQLHNIMCQRAAYLNKLMYDNDRWLGFGSDTYHIHNIAMRNMSKDSIKSVLSMCKSWSDIDAYMRAYYDALKDMKRRIRNNVNKIEDMLTDSEIGLMEDF